MDIEQNNDIKLQQLRLKLQKEEYSETILQQDPRYRHYCRQLDRLSVHEDIIYRDYYDETSSVQFRYYQNTLSLNYSNPYMALRINIREFLKCFTRYVKNTTTLALQKSSKNGSKYVKFASKTNGLQTRQPEDALQIDLIPNLPPSGGNENIITALDVFSRYLFAYPYYGRFGY